jgi:two-component system, cell cycle sensor histidine kinase and response regulator CckA
MHESLPTEAFPFQPHGWKFDETTSPALRALERPDRPDRECVLIVDDEPAIRTLGKMSLGPSGYRVLMANSGEAALEILRSQPGAVDLMVLDLVMPGLSGQTILVMLQEQRHPPDVLISSGFTSERLDPEQFDNVLGFLKKPYRPSHLLRAVRQCLDERIRRQIFANCRSAEAAIS